MIKALHPKSCLELKAVFEQKILPYTNGQLVISLNPDGMNHRVSFIVQSSPCHCGMRQDA